MAVKNDRSRQRNIIGDGKAIIRRGDPLGELPVGKSYRPAKKTPKKAK